MWRMAAAVTTAAMVAGGACWAQMQELGEPGKGLALALRQCADCHAVARKEARSPNPDAPRFEAVAKSPGMSSTALTAALRTSHRNMPNIVLEADEMRNVVAYILSLKGQ